MAQRRKLLINLSLQSEFILTVFLVCLLILLINLANGYLLFNHFIASSAPPDDLAVAKKILNSVLAEAKGRLVVLGLINLAIVFCIGLFMSHRFAGPAFKMEREMRQIQDGDLGARVYLRDGDQLTELANGFNRMAEGLVELHNEVDEAGRALIGEVRKLETAQPAHSGNPNLHGLAERLEGALNRFKVPERRG